ncbi:methylmalonyl-CoA mutase family protein [Blastococcus sp. Marseille-P5729]|uniref:methylmalonyl-CoA mutase family protein n=1 Tax=Blastococcus sp. Marseille-P5729 TaxID=2086582 RepID=UPI000D0F603F|nr:methylmalonyl-CoA mutase family protein [Blastococcus sp. Marseille-P5729]
MAEDSVEHLSLRGANDATEQQWQEAVAAVLRKSGRLGEDDDASLAPAKLTKQTTDGIAIAPLAGTDVAQSLAGGPAGADAVRGRPQPQREPGDVPTWDLRVHVVDANDSATAELEGGASSVWVTTRPGAVADLRKALEGVLLDVAPVVLDSADPLADGATLVELAGGKLNEASNLGIDPTGERLLTGSASDVDLAAAATLATENGIRAFVIDASIVHDAGAGEVLELAYAAAAGVDLLRRLDEAGVAVSDAARLLEFRLAATDQQFTTIAKLRAARAIWARICQVLDVDDDVQRQHVVTSGRMMTQFDPFTNLLRTTIATFAAAVGGADAITVQAYDAALGTTDEFGRRMSRNVSNLLVHEAHIGQVTDPAGGAGSMEQLTDDLARAAWAKFTEIEQAGLDSFVDGQLVDELEQAIARRTEAIARRKQAITGVSEFPQTDEQLLDRAPAYSRFNAGGLIKPVHDADGFERLRHNPADKPVFLWPIGSLAASTARQSFAANLLAAGGVPVVTGTAGGGFEAIKAQYDESGSPVVCLVGSDSGYRDEGAALVEQLRAAGVPRVIVAGKPVAELDGVVDDHMAVGQNVLEFLDRTRSALEENR